MTHKKKVVLKYPRKSARCEVGDVIHFPRPVRFNSWEQAEIPAGYYLVERAELEGGGTGHGQYDVYPDGWHVNIRQVRHVAKSRTRQEDFIYNPIWPDYDFYQSGCFNMKLYKPVTVVARMQRTFVYVGEA